MEKNRKIIVIGGVGVCLLLAITTFTYALWEKLFTQTGENKTTTSCFEVELQGGEDVTLNNAFPQPDSEGLKNEPYIITINNTCDTLTGYNIILNKKSDSSLDESHIKVAVDGKYDLLSQMPETTTNASLNNYTSNNKSRIIGSGFALGKTKKEVRVVTWIENSTSKPDGENKTFTYKITIEATPTTSNNVSLRDMILASGYHTETPDFSKGFPNKNTPTEDIPKLSGLYVTEDDDGNSYYFRGKVNNNYVKFGTIYLTGVGSEEHPDGYADYSYEGAISTCSTYDLAFGDKYQSEEECIADIQEQTLVWRIVRINGDGSIRIILNDKTYAELPLYYNNTSNQEKYVGYTYDNGKSCTKADPCDKDTGTTSNVKLALDEWLDNNLADDDKYIAQTSYCNDTTFSLSENDKYYGAFTRIRSGMPSLKCPDTSESYGGLYKQKIGLITVDELNMGGLTTYSATQKYYATTENYLYKNFGYSWWTMSPEEYVGTAHVFEATSGNFEAIDLVNNTTNYPIPVINLKGNVLVDGLGTESNPYEVVGLK